MTFPKFIFNLYDPHSSPENLIELSVKASLLYQMARKAALNIEENHFLDELFLLYA